MIIIFNTRVFDFVRALPTHRLTARSACLIIKKNTFNMSNNNKTLFINNKTLISDIINVCFYKKTIIIIITKCIIQRYIKLMYPSF